MERHPKLFLKASVFLKRKFEVTLSGTSPAKTDHSVERQSHGTAVHGRQPHGTTVHGKQLWMILLELEGVSFLKQYALE